MQTVHSENFQIHLRNSGSEIIWDKEDYLKAFEKVQAELAKGDIQKLVLSRIKEVETEKHALVLFQDLNKNYSNTFNYLFSSTETGTWIGATPELLLKSSDNKISTVAIAGTKPNDGFSEWTKKEYEEQKMVTDFIVSTFSEKKVLQLNAGKPYTLKAGPVEHLKTEITGLLSDKNLVLDLIQSLHPTSATCGLPQHASKEKIGEIESHKRKLYTGFIGILNDSEKTFFVNLRCLELQKKRALLYVGGGITKASDGDREWIETEKKAETLKRFL